MTATVLSIDSIDEETLVANRIKKNTQEILKTRGHKILIIKKFIALSSVNHKLKSANANIKKIIIGSAIIEIITIKRETIKPLISFGIFNFKSCSFCLEFFRFYLKLSSCRNILFYLNICISKSCFILSHLLRRNIWLSH